MGRALAPRGNGGTPLVVGASSAARRHSARFAKPSYSNLPPSLTSTVTIVPGLEPVAALHRRELPQKDNLCGAFWGTLALRGAGVTEVDGEPVDQDLVALHAGTTLPEGDPETFVPHGAVPRNDYRLELPLAADPEASGTSAPALARSIERLSGGKLAVVPVAGHWSGESVLDLVEIVAETAPEALALANIDTGPLWGSHPDPALVVAHLSGADVDPPPSDWSVGHFFNLLGTIRGPGGSFVFVRDSYASLGWGGHHLQPPDVLAAALERGDGPEGGILCVCPSAEHTALRGRLAGSYELRHWGNGTPDPEGR